MSRELPASALPYLKTLRLSSLAEAEARGLVRLSQYCEQRAIVISRIQAHLKAGVAKIYWTQDASKFRTRWVDPKELDEGLLAVVRDTSATARAIKLWREHNPHGYKKLEMGVAADGDEEEDADVVVNSDMISRLRRAVGMSGKGSLTPVEARAIQTAIRAEQEYLKLQELKGRLIDKEEARAEAFKLAREYSTRIMTWPSRAAPSLAAKLKVPVGDIARALKEAIQSELEAIADMQARGFDLLNSPSYEEVSDEDRSGTDG